MLLISNRICGTFSNQSSIIKFATERSYKPKKPATYIAGFLFYSLLIIDNSSLKNNYFKLPTISSGLTQASKSSGVTYPKRTASSFKVVPFLCAV
jgi:hypothetical protein